MAKKSNKLNKPKLLKEFEQNPKFKEYCIRVGIVKMKGNKHGSFN